MEANYYYNLPQELQTIVQKWVGAKELVELVGRLQLPSSFSRREHLPCTKDALVQNMEAVAGFFLDALDPFGELNLCLTHGRYPFGKNDGSKYRTPGLLYVYEDTLWSQRREVELLERKSRNVDSIVICEINSIGRAAYHFLEVYQRLGTARTISKAVEKIHATMWALWRDVDVTAHPYNEMLAVRDFKLLAQIGRPQPKIQEAMWLVIYYGSLANALCGAMGSHGCRFIDWRCM